MKVIKPSYQILTPINGLRELKLIEYAGRKSWKSEEKITPDGESAKRLIRDFIERGHLSVLEHSSLSVNFIVDRGVSHELVRHRIASYTQESTRYCNYTKDKFGNEITFIEPCFWQDSEFERENLYAEWYGMCQEAEDSYFELLKHGATPQQARAVLPNSLKTELVMTTNYREWRHFFKLRCDPTAHPQMREIAIPLLQDLNRRIPVIFEDLPFANEQEV